MSVNPFPLHSNAIHVADQVKGWLLWVAGSGPVQKLKEFRHLFFPCIWGAVTYYSPHE